MRRMLEEFFRKCLLEQAIERHNQRVNASAAKSQCSQGIAGFLPNPSIHIADDPAKADQGGLDIGFLLSPVEFIVPDPNADDRTGRHRLVWRFEVISERPFVIVVDERMAAATF